ncbi:hypothetical protein FLAN108750_04945 [Flavobacterium antarcticum]
MIISIILLVAILITGCITGVQIHTRKLKKNHEKVMSNMQSTLSELKQNQKNLEQKIHLLEDFDAKYKFSRSHLNQEILAIQYEFLKKII